LLIFGCAEKTENLEGGYVRVKLLIVTADPLGTSETDTLSDDFKLLPTPLVSEGCSSVAFLPYDGFLHFVRINTGKVTSVDLEGITAWYDFEIWGQVAPVKKSQDIVRWLSTVPITAQLAASSTLNDSLKRTAMLTYAENLNAVTIFTYSPKQKRKTIDKYPTFNDIDSLRTAIADSACKLKATSFVILYNLPLLGEEREFASFSSTAQDSAFRKTIRLLYGRGQSRAERESTAKEVVEKYIEKSKTIIQVYKTAGKNTTNKITLSSEDAGKYLMELATRDGITQIDVEDLKFGDNSKVMSVTFHEIVNPAVASPPARKGTICLFNPHSDYVIQAELSPIYFKFKTLQLTIGKNNLGCFAPVPAGWWAVHCKENYLPGTDSSGLRQTDFFVESKPNQTTIDTVKNLK
jgi:hypothetical protein